MLESRDNIFLAAFLSSAQLMLSAFDHNFSSPVFMKLCKSQSNTNAEKKKHCLHDDDDNSVGEMVMSSLSSVRSTLHEI